MMDYAAELISAMGQSRTYRSSGWSSRNLFCFFSRGSSTYENRKMGFMMKKYSFIMLIRNSPKFQGYPDKILEFCKPDETCLVYSMFHGYIDNLEDNTAFNPSTFRFVEQFRERGCVIEEREHTSGHASKQDLIRLCQQINPGIIVPIHKDENADIKNILPDELKGKVREYHYWKDGIEIVFDPQQKYHASRWCDAVGLTDENVEKAVSILNQ